MKKIISIIVLTPIYNDWECFSRLCIELNNISNDLFIHIIGVNDGSNEDNNLDPKLFENLNNINSIELLNLQCNLGHQRAIAIGLSYINNKNFNKNVIIMDSDGEDNPKDILNLIKNNISVPSNIILAQRSQRSEGIIFKIFYYFYRLIFLTLTGHRISFGNFSLIPIDKINKLIYMSSLWNNLSATIIRSRLIYTLSPTIRSNRYFGKSKMNISSLILHGLQSISVFAEIVVLRAAIFFLMLVIFSIFITLITKLFTNIFIPGFATEIITILIVLLFQIISTISVTGLILLNNRILSNTVPALAFSSFISSIMKIK
jgi:hypothetical protein